jgi:hypothetical protein
MTKEQIDRAAPPESTAQAVTKPSPARKAAAKPEAPTAVNRQVNDATATDSIAAPTPPAAPAPQQLAATGRALQTTPNAAAAPLAQPPQGHAHEPAKAAPTYTLRTYDRLSAGRSPDGSAQISGTITDNSGAAVGHAKVTLDQAAGTAHRETLTDGAGRFTISSLQPGKYRLQISSPGFTAQTREVDLGTSQLARVDSQLAVGAASETVTVQAGASTLKTESASVQSLLPGQEPLETSVSSGPRTLALDSVGKLFLSKKAGKHWKTIHGPWKKSPVTGLLLTPDQLFKVTSAQGSWLSDDGEHWRPAN